MRPLVHLRDPCVVHKPAVKAALMEHLNPDQFLTESLLEAILLTLFCVVLNIYSAVLILGSAT